MSSRRAAGSRSQPRIPRPSTTSGSRASSRRCRRSSASASRAREALEARARGRRLPPSPDRAASPAPRDDPRACARHHPLARVLDLRPPQPRGVRRRARPGRGRASRALRVPLRLAARSRASLRLCGYKREWIVLGLILLGTMPLVSVLGAQDSSRIALTDSIVKRGEVNIDPYWKLTIDRAFKGGHWYSDKAPGVSLLLIPAVETSRAVDALAKPNDRAHPIWLRKWTLWGMRLWGGGIAFLVLAFLLGRVAEGLVEGTGAVTAAVFGVGNDGRLARADGFRPSTRRPCALRRLHPRDQGQAATRLDLGRRARRDRGAIRVSGRPRRPHPRGLRGAPRRPVGCARDASPAASRP